MKWRIVIFIAVFAAALSADNPQVIAAGSAGLVVTLKEKYGGYRTDTATVVMIRDGAIWLTHKSFPTTVYSLTNWALTSITKLSGRGRGTDGSDTEVGIAVDSAGGMVSGGCDRRDVEYMEVGGTR